MCYNNPYRELSLDDLFFILDELLRESEQNDFLIELIRIEISSRY